MAWRLLLLALFLAASSHSLRAVANYTTGTATPTYNTTAPTTQITNWQTGWTQPTVQPAGTTYTTGWNYVGSIDGSQSGNASGVYLGYGWVITCAHLGTGSLNFTLNGRTYPYVANSVQSLTGTATQKVVSSGTTTTTTVTNQVDFILFQVSPAPSLPPLPLRSTNPVQGTGTVVMIGYGDGGNKTNETWGANIVNYPVSNYINLSGTSLWSNDFVTADGSSAEYQVVGGDSGGGDFIYNATLARWELAGLNEGESPGAYSAFVQLNDSTFSTPYANTPATGETTTYSGTTTYAAQIFALAQPPPTDTPTMPTWALAALGGLLGLAAVPSILLVRR